LKEKYEDIYVVKKKPSNGLNIKRSKISCKLHVIKDEDAEVSENSENQREIF
jgi:hypothetical protein